MAVTTAEPQGEELPAEAAGPRISFARIAAIVAVALVLAVIGWQIVANTAADNLAGRDPQSALLFRPDSSSALAALAEQQFATDGATDAALASVVALAQRALLADPLDPDALRVLALAAAVKGDEAKARALMELAAAHNERDYGAELWLLDDAAHRGDFTAALRDVDTILRTQPQLNTALFQQLIAISSDPDGEKAMVAALGGDPPWRGWFLHQLPTDPAGLTVDYSILAGLAATANPPQNDEIGPYLDAEIAAGDFPTAFVAWIGFLPPSEAKDVPFVFNGDFELPISGLAFDWKLTDVQGADTEVLTSADFGVGKALRVVFSNTRVPYNDATKLMILSPGTYQLTGMVKSDALTTARGMAWTVSCAEGDAGQLAASPDFAGTFDWKQFAMTFTVPDDSCRAQTLQLVLDARSPLEQQVVGTFWSDALSVMRLPDPPPASTATDAPASAPAPAAANSN